MGAVSDSPKPDRGQVSRNDDTVIRHLMKISGKSKADVLAAIKKVGTNIQTVRKELNGGLANRREASAEEMAHVGPDREP